MKSIPIKAIPRMQMVMEIQIMHLPQNLMVMRKKSDSSMAAIAAPTNTIHPYLKSVAQALKTFVLTCWKISTLLMLVAGRQ